MHTSAPWWWCSVSEGPPHVLVWTFLIVSMLSQWKLKISQRIILLTFTVLAYSLQNSVTPQLFDRFRWNFQEIHKWVSFCHTLSISNSVMFFNLSPNLLWYLGLLNENYGGHDWNLVKKTLKKSMKHWFIWQNVYHISVWRRLGSFLGHGYQMLVSVWTLKRRLQNTMHWYLSTASNSWFTTQKWVNSISWIMQWFW